MSIADMDRKMAERHFSVRLENLKDRIRSLPLPEKFRLVAEFLDNNLHSNAKAVARLALSELENLL